MTDMNFHSYPFILPAEIPIWLKKRLKEKERHHKPRFFVKKIAKKTKLNVKYIQH